MVAHARSGHRVSVTTRFAEDVEQFEPGSSPPDSPQSPGGHVVDFGDMDRRGTQVSSVSEWFEGGRASIANLDTAELARVVALAEMQKAEPSKRGTKSGRVDAAKQSVIDALTFVSRLPANIIGSERKARASANLVSLLQDPSKKAELKHRGKYDLDYLYALTRQIKHLLIQKFGTLDAAFTYGDLDCSDHLSFQQWQRLLKHVGLELEVRLSRALYEKGQHCIDPKHPHHHKQAGADGRKHHDPQLTHRQFCELVMSSSLQDLGRTFRSIEEYRKRVRGRVDTFLRILVLGEPATRATHARKFQHKLETALPRFWKAACQHLVDQGKESLTWDESWTLLKKTGPFMPYDVELGENCFAVLAALGKMQDGAADGQSELKRQSLTRPLLERKYSEGGTTQQLVFASRKAKGMPGQPPARGMPGQPPDRPHTAGNANPRRSMAPPAHRPSTATGLQAKRGSVVPQHAGLDPHKQAMRRQSSAPPRKRVKKKVAKNLELKGTDLTIGLVLLSSMSQRSKFRMCFEVFDDDQDACLVLPQVFDLAFAVRRLALVALQDPDLFLAEAVFDSEFTLAQARHFFFRVLQTLTNQLRDGESLDAQSLVQLEELWLAVSSQPRSSLAPTPVEDLFPTTQPIQWAEADLPTYALCLKFLNRISRVVEKPVDQGGQDERRLTLRKSRKATGRLHRHLTGLSGADIVSLHGDGGEPPPERHKAKREAHRRRMMTDKTSGRERAISIASALVKSDSEDEDDFFGIKGAAPPKRRLSVTQVMQQTKHAGDQMNEYSGDAKTRVAQVLRLDTEDLGGDALACFAVHAARPDLEEHAIGPPKRGETVWEDDVEEMPTLIFGKDAHTRHLRACTGRRQPPPKKREVNEHVPFDCMACQVTHDHPWTFDELPFRCGMRSKSAIDAAKKRQQLEGTRSSATLSTTASSATLGRPSTALGSSSATLHRTQEAVADRRQEMQRVQASLDALQMSGSLVMPKEQDKRFHRRCSSAGSLRPRGAPPPRPSTASSWRLMGATLRA